MRRTHAVPTLLSIMALGLASCGDRDLGPDTLARAAGLQFGVEEAAELIAPADDLPSDPAVVEALTDFWVDYVLLAMVVNEEGALDGMNLSALTRPELNQQLVLLLRDEVIDVDTAVSDEELQEIYETERPGERVRARHILLLFPEGATPAQRDSVWALARELRDRARAGADFAALATEYSDDEGSAARGGDLNFFARETMVAAFDDAAFALDPGEVSDVVETEYGLHVIRLEERERPELEDIREQLRSEIQQERTMTAESIFVAGIEEPAEVRLADDAVERVREMAGDLDGEVSGAAARQALVHFSEGAFTADDFQDFLSGQSVQLREQIEGATDDELDGFLRNLARRELLVREAESRGLSVPESEIEELEEELRGEYRRLAGLLELDAIEVGEGESLRQAVEREIGELLPQLVRGEREVYPLGQLAIPLRVHYDVRIARDNFERTIERVEEIRAQAAPPEEPALPEPQRPDPDTSGPDAPPEEPGR